MTYTLHRRRKERGGRGRELPWRWQSCQSENRQQRALRQRLISMVWHGNGFPLGVCPDEVTSARAIMPEVGGFEYPFDLSVVQGFHRETFSPSPKSMPSVTSTRYLRSSASFPPSVKHSGCPRTSARYRSPSCVTSAIKCSPCVSNSMTDGTSLVALPHGLPRVDTMSTSVFASASSRLMPYRCNLRSARRQRSRSSVKVLSSVCMVRIIPKLAACGRLKI